MPPFKCATAMIVKGAVLPQSRLVYQDLAAVPHIVKNGEYVVPHASGCGTRGTHERMKMVPGVRRRRVALVP